MDTSLEPESRGRLGELKLEQLCVEGGLTANRVGHDRTGWDFNVEFPFSPDRRARLDSRPSPPQARVQVKTVMHKETSFKIRLSAAERLAKYPLTAFICVMAMDGGQVVRAVYVLHVMGDVLSRILKELRQCEATNSLLVNRKSISMPVSLGIRIEVSASDLREELRASCGNRPDEYEEQKKHQLANLGFDAVRYTGRFTLEATSESDMADVFLGLKPGQASDFQLTEVRWNIPLLASQPSDKAQVNITPTPRKAEVTVYGKAGRLAIKSNAYFQPVLTATSAKIRIVSEIADVILDARACTFSVSTPSPAYGLPIQQHLRMNKLQRLFMRSGKVELRIEHKLVAGGKFQNDKFNLEPERLLSSQNLLRHVERITSAAGAEQTPLAVPAINEQFPQIGLMSAIISGVARTSAISFKATVRHRFFAERR
jgi:hypothetical protein